MFEVEHQQLIVGVGVAVATFLGMLLLKATQSWQSKEGTLLNLSILLDPPTQPDPMIGKPIIEQVAYLDKLTKKLETALPDSASLVGYLCGKDVAAASFGPTQTQVAKVFVPSHETGRKIPILCTRPHGATGELPLIIYFYMGGMVIGSPETELKMIRYLAQETQSVVCAVDYRKAPVHPFPAATDDAYDASRFLIENGKSQSNNPLFKALGVTIDPSRVVTFGTSAGGYLAAHTARRLAVEGISIQLQVAFVPCVKPHGETSSVLKNGKNDYWNRRWNTYAWNAYLPQDDGTLAKDWKVNLLVDPPGGAAVLERLPPVYLQIHQRDILYDEGKLYAEKLAEQQKLLELVEYDTIHVGGLIPFSNGGPADGSFQRALLTVKKYLA